MRTGLKTSSGGGVFMHLDGRLNFHRLFEEVIAEFDIEETKQRQQDSFIRAGVPLP